jgi:hypothetical protein
VASRELGVFSGDSIPCMKNLAGRWQGGCGDGFGFPAGSRVEDSLDFLLWPLRGEGLRF